jgi:phosphoribosylformylglycinamidine synthase
MLLSESQERMLMVLKPGSEPEAEAIFRKWGLDFAVIGRTNDSGRMVVRHKGQVEADIPVATLADSAPLYERPWVPTPAPKRILAEWIAAPDSVLGALKTIMGHPQACSRRWVWEQYDHMVMGDTIQRPGGDAAVVRIHGTNKAIAATCDVTPRYVLADPAMGTKQAVAETWRNLSAVGAEPLAITDNLNYANPERPEIMGQFVQSIEGMKEACLALAYPVVAGNVSLYNETNGVGIPPTPAIGGVGIIKDLSQRADLSIKNPGNRVISIGREEGHLGQTLYQQIIVGKLEGAPPPVDLAAERAAGEFVRSLIRESAVGGVHDVSDGGLIVAIAEMALAGDIGVEIFPYEGKLPAHAIWFGEDQGRYLIEVTPETADSISDRARQMGLATRIVGRTGGNALSLASDVLPLSDLRAAHEAWLPAYMDGDLVV